MIDYLSDYNLSLDDIKVIKKRFNKDIISKFEIMECNVKEVLNYLKEMGIINFKELILNRPDICFMSIYLLKDKTSKFDKDLIKFIFEKEVDNLINFDI